MKTQTKEIEITKELHGLTYILSGELLVTYHESPYKEENPAYQIEELYRHVNMPWLNIIEDKSGEHLWDKEPTKPQLKFFETEINEIEI